MKKLLKQISEINHFIEQHQIKSISFDIDGTLYPKWKATLLWFKSFLIGPKRAHRFKKLVRYLDSTRNLEDVINLSQSDQAFMNNFLMKNVYKKITVSPLLIDWITHLNQKGINILYLTDHFGEDKLRYLNLPQHQVIDCLKLTHKLKPHPTISKELKKQNLIAQYHLHLGDRISDKEQACHFGCHFKYFYS